MESRERAISRVSWIGIGVNMALAGLKMAVGALAGSLSIVLDGLNNLTDAGSSVITIVSLRLAHRKPDAKHPYGHGRIEYFSAVAISSLVLVAGGTALLESVKSLLHPQMATYTPVTIGLILTSVAVKLALGRYVSDQGKKYNSGALSASGADASMDGLLSASTLLAVGANIFFQWPIEGLVGALLSGFIIKAGVDMLLDSISQILGKRADGEFTAALRATVESFPSVLGAYDLVLHNYGPEFAMASINVELPGDMTAREIHRLSRGIQAMVWQKHRVVINVGVYGVERHDPEVVAIQESVSSILRERPGVVDTHGILVDRKAGWILVDITVDFSIKDTEAFEEWAKGRIRQAHPEYTPYVNLDTHYSD